MFVFYDVETTGINVVFDQILQFAAILTDDNFNEVDRFNIRCRILPWIVPSPAALIITNTDTDLLTSEELPDFYEMVSQIYEKLTSWSPAVFIGYNSIAFDEVFLHRAFWQGLYPPYLTVTAGNSRFDLLQMIRMFLKLQPGALLVPKKDNGNDSLKLDLLAPANGLKEMVAHDAMGDVEAAIFLAQKLNEYDHDLWSTLLTRSDKYSVAKHLIEGAVILFSEIVKGKSSLWFGKVISNRDYSPSTCLIAKLDYNWSELSVGISESVIESIRTVSFNKSPSFLSLDEAEHMFGMVPTDEEYRQSEYIDNNKKLRSDLIDWIKNSERIWPSSEELEQKIYEGFPSREDEVLARKFHQSTLVERVEVSARFSDKKYQELANRILYIKEPCLLSGADKEKLENMIRKRRSSTKGEILGWRSSELALIELAKIEEKNFATLDQVAKIRHYLENLKKNGLKN